MITSPTKPVELTASERHVILLACKYYRKSRSTKEFEQAVIKDVIPKLERI